MQDLPRRHPLRRCGPCPLAGMLGEKPIGPPLTQRIELDALDNEAPIRQIAGLTAIQMIGFENLQLQGHRQSVRSPPIAQAHEHFAAFGQRAHDQRLQPGKVRQSIGITACRKVEPQAIGGLGEGFGLSSRTRHNPGADQIADERMHALGGIRVVADKIARPIAQPGQGWGDFRIGSCPSGHPAIGAPAHQRAFKAAFENGKRMPIACAALRRAWRELSENARQPAHASLSLWRRWRD